MEKEFGISRYDYFEYAWNIPPEHYLKKDSRVINFIKKIRLRKGILNNAPMVWVRNVLKFLSFEDEFEWIHTGEGEIRKPDLRVYEKLLTHFKLPPSAIIIIDDEPKYLWIAKKIGFITALMGKIDNEFDISGCNTLEVLKNWRENLK